MPGRISISSPTLNLPWAMVPPIMPPSNSSIWVPGLFTSKERMMYMRGGLVSSLLGVGMISSMALSSMSMFISCCAEIGIMGAFSAIVPLTKFFISS